MTADLLVGLLAMPVIVITVLATNAIGESIGRRIKR